MNINLLDELERMPKNNEDAYYIIIRFNDFSPRIQQEMVSMIKRYSPIRTIRKRDSMVTNEQIFEILSKANPVINIQHKQTFSRQPIINSWYAQRLSSMIYHFWRVVFKNYKPNLSAIDFFIRRFISRRQG